MEAAAAETAVAEMATVDGPRMVLEATIKAVAADVVAVDAKVPDTDAAVSGYQIQTQQQQQIVGESVRSR